MEELLKRKLQAYLLSYHPDLLLHLQDEASLTEYINERMDNNRSLLHQLQADNLPPYIIQEFCMSSLTRDLRPSKYQYILTLLEEEFEADYARLKAPGLLLYEIINLISQCESVFEELGFTEENESSRVLRYAIMGMMREYLEAAP